MSLKNNLPMKTVMITGATSGIGKATAKYFAKKGYNVIITGRRKEKLDEIVEKFTNKYGAKMKSLCFDITKLSDAKKAIDSLYKNWKQIDILVNNAGGARGLNSVQAGEIADWEYMIDANIKGLLYVTRLVAPKMVENEKGHIKIFVQQQVAKYMRMGLFTVQQSMLLMLLRKE
jgi:3-hydroxy acid dehydrogenase / malonic semialdehyde reductase